MKLLKSYNEKEMLGYFTDGRTVYELHIEEISFFGLKKKKIVCEYSIPYYRNNQDYFDLWDKKIDDKIPIKKNTDISMKEGLILILILIIFIPVIFISDLID